MGGNPILPGMSGMQMMPRMNLLTPQLLNPQGVGGPQGVQMRPMTLPPNLQGAFGQSGQPGPQGMPVIRLGPGGLIPMGVPMVNSQVPPPHGVNPQMPRLPHPPFLHQPPPSDVHPGLKHVLCFLCSNLKTCVFRISATCSSSQYPNGNGKRSIRK